MEEYRNVDLILGETLSIFTEVQLLKPVCNLLHRGPRVMRSSSSQTMRAKPCCFVYLDLEH